uniref:Uncharacterized protein n=1 Tax=Desertifilum tharense IPPAS B-1220 TaxID=1781255 RepID=A0ACD5H2H8_9CYAN
MPIKLRSLLYLLWSFTEAIAIFKSHVTVTLLGVACGVDSTNRQLTPNVF